MHTKKQDANIRSGGRAGALVARSAAHRIAAPSAVRLTAGSPSRGTGNFSVASSPRPRCDSKKIAPTATAPLLNTGCAMLAGMPGVVAEPGGPPQLLPHAPGRAPPRAQPPPRAAATLFSPAPAGSISEISYYIIFNSRCIRTGHRIGPERDPFWWFRRTSARNGLKSEHQIIGPPERIT